MRNLLLVAILSFTLSISSNAQLLSYELIDQYSIGRLDSMIDNAAPGASLFFQATYPVDLYKITYLTPYIHLDSLVKVSGAVSVPRNTGCDIPLGAYFHGTIGNRINVPSNQSQEATIGVLMATDGFMVSMPDYLGLGDSDTNVIIHPYIHAFSQGHTSVNSLRASRELADSLNIGLNGQVFLGGYSQGGFTTMATHKLIEEEFPFEFEIAASVPMSGPYDLKEAQVDLIVSDSVYPTPGYLPYIILSYHSMYDTLQQLYPDVNALFKAPYDTFIVDLFYEGNLGMGQLNNICTPVPKHILKDSFVMAFETDSLHPFRLVLEDNHLLDWAPQAPVKLIYCHGDDQVTYLNSIRAYESWTTNGSQDVDTVDLGDTDHAGCAERAVVSALLFLDAFRDSCITGVNDRTIENIKISPNPAQGQVAVQLPNTGDYDINLISLSGQQVKHIASQNNRTIIDLNGIVPGVYFLEILGEEKQHHAKLIVH